MVYPKILKGTIVSLCRSYDSKIAHIDVPEDISVYISVFDLWPASGTQDCQN